MLENLCNVENEEFQWIFRGNALILYFL
jgi:hypothetical protein